MSVQLISRQWRIKWIKAQCPWISLWMIFARYPIFFNLRGAHDSQLIITWRTSTNSTPYHIPAWRPIYSTNAYILVKSALKFLKTNLHLKQKKRPTSSSSSSLFSCLTSGSPTSSFLANRPLTRGRLSARVFRQAYCRTNKRKKCFNLRMQQRS